MILNKIVFSINVHYIFDNIIIFVFVSIRDSILILTMYLFRRVFVRFKKSNFDYMFSLIRKHLTYKTILILFDINDKTLFKIIRHNIRNNKMTTSNVRICAFDIEFRFDQNFERCRNSSMYVQTICLSSIHVLTCVETSRDTILN